jgi:hypothetical protein
MFQEIWWCKVIKTTARMKVNRYLDICLEKHQCSASFPAGADCSYLGADALDETWWTRHHPRIRDAKNSRGAPATAAIRDDPTVKARFGYWKITAAMPPPT